jgi:hypothetical protein
MAAEQDATRQAHRLDEVYAVRSPAYGEQCIVWGAHHGDGYNFAVLTVVPLMEEEY